MRINQLRLKSGEDIALTNNITVLVGPNNSGKSQTLKDIRYMMDRNRAGTTSPVILMDDNSVFEIPSYGEIKKDITIYKSKNAIDHFIIEGIVSDLLNKESITIHKSQIDNIGAKNTFFDWFSKYYLALMNAETRLMLSSKVSSYNTQEEKPGNLLQALLLDSDSERKLQVAFRGAFDEDIKLDYSPLQFLCLRVGKDLPNIPTDVREAVPITKDIPKIDDQGDGYRSFAGIVLGLLLSKKRIILLDEPEAFLHPAQAFYLGKWISDNSESFQSQIIICTHSASFLRGIIGGKCPAEVFRLNRTNDVTRFIHISTESTRLMSVNPVLSSQRVMEGIFYKGVVVCEADADRSVYQSVASVCHQSNGNILFIHAHNKQTLPLVVGALRQAGIPCVAIADIDILHGDNDIWSVYKALTQHEYSEELEELRSSIDTYVESRPENEVFEQMKSSVQEFVQQLDEGGHDLEGAKSALKRIYKNAGKWSVVKQNGVEWFDTKHQADINRLIEALNKVGLFIVPVGELEGWIDLGVRKGRWTVTALTHIQNGNTPEQLRLFVKQVLDFFTAQY